MWPNRPSTAHGSCRLLHVPCAAVAKVGMLDSLFCHQPGQNSRPMPASLSSCSLRQGRHRCCRKAAEQHAAAFSADKTHNLVVRLRHNVIRAGLKRISLAYSRISLKDIASKLGLQNVEDTESIVAKAIRWGACSSTRSEGPSLG